MRQLLAGMSPRLGGCHVPRALSAGLHIPSNAVNKLLIFYRKVNRNLKFEFTSVRLGWVSTYSSGVARGGGSK
jgi:hypothetical protein